MEKKAEEALALARVKAEQALTAATMRITQLEQESESWQAFTMMLIARIEKLEHQAAERGGLDVVR